MSTENPYALQLAELGELDLAFTQFNRDPSVLIPSAISQGIRGRNSSNICGPHLFPHSGMFSASPIR
jgi:hypothetical protein